MLCRLIGQSRAEIEEELARGALLGSDELAEETLKDFEARDAEFEQLYSKARPAFDRIFENKAAKRPDAPKLIEVLMGETGASWLLATGLYRRGCGIEIDESGVRAFAEVCPPFKAVMLSLCIAQYYRCIRDMRGEGTYRAGRLDLFMAAYVPYCDRFITNDTGQLNSLRLVASDAAPSTEILSYTEFRRGLVI